MQQVFARRLLLFCSIALGGATLDLWTKHVMFGWSALDGQGQVYWLWPDYVGFQRSLNEGAVFGMGQGMVPLFAAISVVALIAIPVWLFRYGAAQDIWFTVALAAITAGVVGNLYDRLGLPGLDWQILDPSRAGERVYAVRDFILMQLSDQRRWPNYNIADSLLVGGAGLAFIRSLFAPQQDTDAEGQTGSATG